MGGCGGIKLSAPHSFLCEQGFRLNPMRFGHQPSVLTLELGRSSALNGVDHDGDGVMGPEHRVEGVVISDGGLQSH